MAQLDNADIDRRFNHHAPTEDRIHDHTYYRAQVKELAIELQGLPDGPEKPLAFTALEEVGFWTQAAIAREGR